MVGQGGRRTARANRLFSPSSLRHYEISLGPGLAKGTVYNSFPSKQALFLAVIEHGCSLAARAARTVAPDMPIRERLRAASEGDLPRGTPRGRELAVAAGLPVARLIPRSEQFSLRFTNADLHSFELFAPSWGRCSPPSGSC
jgi:AcrR family transcriptional regulator